MLRARFSDGSLPLRLAEITHASPNFVASGFLDLELTLLGHSSIRAIASGDSYGPNAMREGFHA